MDIRMAPKLAINNKTNLKLANECACYYCLKSFNYENVKEWVDNNDTAICPFCSVDAVVPIYEEKDGDIEFLSKIRKYWFGNDR